MQYRSRTEFESPLDILETLIRDAWMLLLQAPPALQSISHTVVGLRAVG